MEQLLSNYSTRGGDDEERQPGVMTDDFDFSVFWRKMEKITLRRMCPKNQEGKIAKQALKKLINENLQLIIFKTVVCLENVCHVDVHATVLHTSFSTR